MGSERQQRPSPILEFAARLVGGLVALDLALVTAIWLSGPLRIDRSALPFDLTAINPIAVLLVLAPLWCLLRWRHWRRWLGVPADARLALRRVHPAAWLALPVSALFLGSQLWSALEHVVPIPQMLHKSARRGPATMALNAANRHAAGLVRQLIRRPDPKPVVVWIDDLDHRGHTAAFYAYPRLLLMEPRQREWSVRVRMTARGGANPLFRVGHRPSVDHSRAFALERGTELVFASSKRFRERRP